MGRGGYSLPQVVDGAIPSPPVSCLLPNMRAEDCSGDERDADHHVCTKPQLTGQSKHWTCNGCRCSAERSAMSGGHGRHWERVK
jgi:hypothetical protein